MFRDLCENAHDLIQSVTPEGRFLYVNRAWMRTLGYSAEELPGLTVFDIIHPDSVDHCRQVMQQVMEGEAVLHIEAEFVSKEGRRIPVEGSATCRFESGKPVATRGIFRDVSRRRHVQDEVDRLFHLSLDLLCVAGVDGYFRQVNPAFEEILGFTEAELLSRPFIELVHPDDRARTRTQIENLERGLNVVDFQNRCVARDGSHRWIAWRSAPLQERGLIYGVGRDITEHREAQEGLRRSAEELARSNADLEQFAYAASHDLLTPLRAIGQLSEWIEEDLAEGDRERSAEHLAELRARVRRMETLTDDLLQYSRAGTARVELGRVELAGLVKELTFLLAPPEGFTVEAGGDLPVFETARAPLEHVLRNLLDNALKHHDRDQGHVTVSAAEAGEYYEFQVADDGPGIAAEDQTKIFQMFQKLQSRDRVEGNGMGLSLVKRIVERFGGRVALDSGPGRGATFRFTWPRRIASGGGAI